MAQSNTESWSGGDAYDYFMGRWSRLTAYEFVSWLNPEPNRTWLDIGCGTGALAKNVLDQYAPQTVYIADPSWNFVFHAQQNLKSGNVRAAVSFADTIPLKNQTCDYVISGLMLNFTSDPITAVQEMKRITKSGGFVAAYVWDYADKMQWLRYFWDAALEIDGSAGQYDEGQRFPLCQKDPLAETFRQAGLEDVQVVPIDINTHFKNFEAYWSPFLSGEFPAPHYFKSLSVQKQAALKESVQVMLPIEDDGHIHLIARAWAVKGSSSL